MQSKPTILEDMVSDGLHLKGTRNGPTHPCKACDRLFGLPENLRKHRLIHHDKRPHKCPYCMKTFKLSQHLKEHVRIHTGEKPYKCHVCGHAFCQISNLKSHEQTHSKTKAFKCGICEKQFRRSFTLKQHLAKHIDEEPWQVSMTPVCPVRTSISANRTNHDPARLAYLKHEQPFPERTIPQVHHQGSFLPMKETKSRKSFQHFRHSISSVPALSVSSEMTCTNEMKSLSDGGPIPRSLQRNVLHDSETSSGTTLEQLHRILDLSCKPRLLLSSSPKRKEQGSLGFRKTTTSGLNHHPASNMKINHCKMAMRMVCSPYEIKSSSGVHCDGNSATIGCSRIHSNMLLQQRSSNVFMNGVDKYIPAELAQTNVSKKRKAANHPQSGADKLVPSTSKDYRFAFERRLPEIEDVNKESCQCASGKNRTPQQNASVGKNLYTPQVSPDLCDVICHSLSPSPVVKQPLSFVPNDMTPVATLSSLDVGFCSQCDIDLKNATKAFVRNGFGANVQPLYVPMLEWKPIIVGWKSILNARVPFAK